MFVSSMLMCTTDCEKTLLEWAKLAHFQQASAWGQTFRAKTTQKLGPFFGRSSNNKLVRRTPQSDHLAVTIPKPGVRLRL